MSPASIFVTVYDLSFELTWRLLDVSQAVQAEQLATAKLAIQSLLGFQ
jgi:hypothetical protein